MNVVSVTLRDGSGWWEVCLAVIETETVYYLHNDLCSEVGIDQLELSIHSFDQSEHSIHNT